MDWVTYARAERKFRQGKFEIIIPALPIWPYKFTGSWESCLLQVLFQPIVSPFSPHPIPSIHFFSYDLYVNEIRIFSSFFVSTHPRSYSLKTREARKQFYGGIRELRFPKHTHFCALRSTHICMVRKQFYFGIRELRFPKCPHLCALCSTHLCRPASCRTCLQKSAVSEPMLPWERLPPRTEDGYETKIQREKSRWTSLAWSELTGGTGHWEMC